MSKAGDDTIFDLDMEIGGETSASASEGSPTKGTLPSHATPPRERSDSDSEGNSRRIYESSTPPNDSDALGCTLQQRIAQLRDDSAQRKKELARIAATDSGTLSNSGKSTDSATNKAASSFSLAPSKPELGIGQRYIRSSNSWTSAEREPTETAAEKFKSPQPALTVKRGFF